MPELKLSHLCSRDRHKQTSEALASLECREPSIQHVMKLVCRGFQTKAVHTQASWRTVHREGLHGSGLHPRGCWGCPRPLCSSSPYCIPWLHPESVLRGRVSTKHWPTLPKGPVCPTLRVQPQHLGVHMAASPRKLTKRLREALAPDTCRGPSSSCRRTLPFRACGSEPAVQPLPCGLRKRGGGYSSCPHPTEAPRARSAQHSICPAPPPSPHFFHSFSQIRKHCQKKI